MAYYPPGFGLRDCSRINSVKIFLQGRYEIPSSIPPQIVIPGRCGNFGELFSEVLKVNNIPHAEVAVESTATHNSENYLFMMIKKWSCSGEGTYAQDLKAKWQLRLEKGVMVPEQESYGDCQSLPGIAGQNTTTPSEKVFGGHAIIEIPNIAGDKYFDPSYGKTYQNTLEFEKDAIGGYAFELGFEAYTYLYQVKLPEGKGEIRFEKLD